MPEVVEAGVEAATEEFPEEEAFCFANSLLRFTFLVQ